MPAPEGAYRLAASLALDLIKVRPTLDEEKAIEIAWEAYREDDPATFHDLRYRDEVIHVMRKIAGRSLQRVEPKLRVKARALARLE